MNAIYDLNKRNDKQIDKLPDEPTGIGSGKSGMISHAEKAELFTKVPSNPINDVYRSLRGLIDQSSTGIVVHVVATTQAEGSSPIAKAIGTTAATAGSCRVLLIDGKLPSHKPISNRRPAGADTNRANDHSTHAPAHLVHGEDTFIGLFTGNISDAIQNEKVDPREVKDAYASWRRDYDLIIVDCPPVASGRYIELVPSAADWVILVVQAEKLRPVVLRRVREMIEQQQGGKILGVILKDAKPYIPKFIYRLI